MLHDQSHFLHFVYVVMTRDLHMVPTLTCSLLEGTTVDADGGILVGEAADDELRRAEALTWTTLVTVMVCLMGFVADCLVTTVPSDGN